MIPCSVIILSLVQNSSPLKLAMELCDTCRAFDIQAFDPAKYPVRGYKLASAISAAESGCPFCSLLAKVRFPQGEKPYANVFSNRYMQWICLQADHDWKRRLESPCNQNNNDNDNTSGLGSPLGLTRLWTIGSFILRVVRMDPLHVLADEGEAIMWSQF
jgi:hypothetical protein